MNDTLAEHDSADFTRIEPEKYTVRRNHAWQGWRGDPMGTGYFRPSVATLQESLDETRKAHRMQPSVRHVISVESVRRTVRHLAKIDPFFALAYLAVIVMRSRHAVRYDGDPDELHAYLSEAYMRRLASSGLETVRFYADRLAADGLGNVAYLEKDGVVLIKPGDFIDVRVNRTWWHIYVIERETIEMATEALHGCLILAFLDHLLRVLRGSHADLRSTPTQTA